MNLTKLLLSPVRKMKKLPAQKIKKEKLQRKRLQKGKHHLALPKDHERKLDEKKRIALKIRKDSSEDVEDELTCCC